MSGDEMDPGPPGDCPVCEEKGTVDPWSGVCSACTLFVHCHCGASYLLEEGTFEPGTPTRYYLRNGDPGYPGDPPEYYCPECGVEGCEDPRCGEAPSEVFRNG